MAVVVGENCGFVSSAPSADPSGASSWTFDGRALCILDTSPAGDNNITEMGWWSATASQAANYEMAIFSNDSSGGDHPNVVIATAVEEAKGTTSQWERIPYSVTSINASTKFWLALQCDATDDGTDVDRSGAVSNVMRYTSPGLTEMPAGSSFSAPDNNWYAIYALYEAAAGANKLLLLQNTLGGDANRMTA